VISEDPKNGESAEQHPSPTLPEVGTQAAIDYFVAAKKALSMFHFIIDTAMRVDHVGHIAKVALDGPVSPGNPDLDITPEQLMKTDPSPKIKLLRRMRQELLELFLASAVDNFETYIVSIVREILRKKPEILRTREQNLTIEYVLQFTSIQELTNEIIEGKINSLSYEGFSALQAWCRKKQIPLAVRENIRENVVELIATRNTIIHNRGRIDDKYLRTVKNSKTRKGEKREIAVGEYFEAEEMLGSIVIATDHAAAAKYGLEAFPVPHGQPFVDPLK
jgi:hypothetical protein